MGANLGSKPTMSSPKTLHLCGLFFLIFFLLSNPLATTETASLDEALASITARQVKSHIAFLTDETLQGRLVGSRGARLASLYIARHFERLGLEPAIEGNSFYQTFLISARELGKKNSLKIFSCQDDQPAPLEAKPLTKSARPGEEEYVLGTDFAPLLISGSGSASGEVVFAGYGITAPEYNYDDYAGLDVKGKIVLVLRYEPEAEDTQAFEGQKLTRHAFFLTKAENAHRRGACALVIINGPGLKNPSRLERWWPYISDEGRLLSPAFALEDLNIQNAPLPLIHMKTSLAEKMLSEEGRSLERLEKKIAGRLSPHSFPLHHIRISLEADVRTTRLKARNVVALLRGSELGDEAIILMAHFDHLGRGKDGYFPGADDNASGVAALLEVAEALTYMPPPRRSILLLATTGEEEGLLGARFYTQHPALPLKNTRAVVNLDTIGRNEPGEISIVGVRQSPWLETIVKKANEKIGLDLKYDAEFLYKSADHYAFAEKDVPAIFFTAKGHEDYHTQRDTPEKLKIKKIARVARLALLTLWMIDQTAPLEVTPLTGTADGSEVAIEPYSKSAIPLPG